MKNKPQKCRVCGCTEKDCRQCIEKTGEPCHWVEKDLCSACVPMTVLAEYQGQLKNFKRKSSPGFPALNFHLKVMSDGKTQELSVLDETGNGFILEFNPGMHYKLQRVIKIPKEH